MKVRHLLIASCLLTLSACEKEETVQTETLVGTLVWTGSSAIDGCGYILTTDENSRDYKPANEAAIPDSYQSGNPISVIVKAIEYKKTIRACMTGSEFYKIEVLSIQKK
jgi:hypothetical protein